MINIVSAKKYCCEDISKIENYEQAVNDKTQTWQCHHKGEILPCGRFSRATLEKFDLLYKRPANELIFLTEFKHKSIHQNKLGYKCSIDTKEKISNALKGRHQSDKTKKKRSDSLKGANAPWFGKHLSEETRRKMSEAHKGQTPWIKGKSLSQECRDKISKIISGMHWYNNGKVQTQARECPPGFVAGRLKKKKQ